MKKKLIAIFLCVALVAVGIVGATIAYFTDDDKVENNFTIGDVKIDLTETAGVKDGDGKDVEGCVKEKDNDGGYTYSNLMAGYKIQKEPVIENTGRQPAYVRVAVVMNKLAEINNAIDEVYEEKDYEAEDIQAIYDKVFDGWGLSYLKTDDEPRRLWMDESDHQPTAGSGVELIGIDMWSRNSSGYGQFSETNLFQSEDEKNSFGDGFVYFDYDCTSYYEAAANVNERIFVFYLKLAPGAQYQLFDGLNVPAEFTQEQAKMFDGLKIGIYADAIQTAGFNDTVDEATGVVTEAAYVKAFNALEAAHSLGWWND